MADKYVTVTTTAGIVHTPGPGENVRIQNMGPGVAWLSTNSGVTTSTAMPLSPGDVWHLYSPYNSIGTGSGVGIFGITASGTTSLSVTGNVT